MDLRDADTADIEPIRTVAKDSLTASYGHVVEETYLEEAAERWYGRADLEEAIDDPATRFIVAIDGGAVVAFAESYVVDRRERVGEIDWIHVDPEERGRGIGSELLDRIERELRDADVDAIEGRVLAENEAGAAFYEQKGYEHTGIQEVDIGSETFEERIYRKWIGETETDAQSAEVHETDDGETVHVAYEESNRGSIAPFYAVYTDEGHTERYGYLCGACEGTNVSIDTMDRVECLECSNRIKPTRWDAAY
ncbi:GNAT family N-acetyltransferase [Halorubrum vacuolatum]|uniref:Ribosomal protein S18 acetylase RimI n=1 Tax=Halorubrum vacuolatum TaxID=63740 RepID=A0A238WLN6_HALVU|nr:GNAT family N-acetyltransferase [Halorubrum vacuolatum]SNR47338.1 Ribosomal protein S18 acetylase RimI [Halorubrum vacuolatum]